MGRTATESQIRERLLDEIAKDPDVKELGPDWCRKSKITFWRYPDQDPNWDIHSADGPEDEVMFRNLLRRIFPKVISNCPHMIDD